MNEPASRDLFPEMLKAEVEKPSDRVPAEVRGIPRLVHPERCQMEWMAQTLDELIPEDHQVRAVWAFIQRLDLDRFEHAIKAVEGNAGRPATDPRVLLALWVYATVEGVGSGRELERLTKEHLAFRWLRGGVPLDYHLLNDFRTDHRKAMDEVLTQIVGVMMKEGLVQINRVAEDGMRVRASAGAGSFHRGETLERHLAEAKEQVNRLTQEAEQSAAHRSRQETVRRQAAEDRQRRIEEALRQLPEVAETKRKQAAAGQKVTPPRVSSTDPDARVMKMGDGGFRPAYNVQFATDTESQVIVGVAVTNQGTDRGTMPPMLDQIGQRTGQLPKEILVDGGFSDKASLQEVDRRKVTVYAPVQSPKKEGVDPYAPKPRDPPAVAEWRRRMATEEAKGIYKERAATAECVNAISKEHRGLRAFGVRGLDKALGVALLVAVTHNILRYLALVM